MFRVARGGANWVVAPLVVSILMVSFSGNLGAPWLVPLSAVLFFLFLLLWWFFRDPERTPHPQAQWVSGADGKVQRIDKVDDDDVGPADRLSVFMGVGNVHVNRAPIDGDVRKVTHYPGKHVPAFRKDSDRNERVETVLRTSAGDVKLVQIAGAVARRIVPYIDPGAHLEKADRIGLIRLGSRFDVIAPRGRLAWTVKAGDRVRGGITEIARAGRSGGEEE